jgi:hypothetical protein
MHFSSAPAKVAAATCGGPLLPVCARLTWGASLRTGSVLAYAAGDECTLLHQFCVAGASILRLGYNRPLDGCVQADVVVACASD